MAELRARNELDVALYASALRLFDARLTSMKAKLPPDQARLAFRSKSKGARRGVRTSALSFDFCMCARNRCCWAQRKPLTAAALVPLCACAGPRGIPARVGQVIAPFAFPKGSSAAFFAINFIAVRQ